MRLLHHGENGQLNVTADLFEADATPPYAILSHTWGADDEEEMTFDDLVKNAGKDKPGYKKIELCGEQAERHGLQYFWVDTCCIDKANKAEHSLFIGSTFRWYRKAARCYVYLPELSALPLLIGGVGSPLPWEPEFRQCKWFTRGWTLQELLAPGVRPKTFISGIDTLISSERLVRGYKTTEGGLRVSFNLHSTNRAEESTSSSLTVGMM